MDAIRLRLRLVEQRRRLVDIHRETGIAYNRLIRIVNGYSRARPEEVQAIAASVGLASKDLDASTAR